MEIQEQLEVFAEAERLELNVADLYYLYAELFPEDKEFWENIAREEENHAALLIGLKVYLKKEVLPPEVFSKNVEELRSVNRTILSKIEKYPIEKPSKKIAYEFAKALENSAYELHYQKLIVGVSDSTVLYKFQLLNGADKDHAERIGALIKSYNL